MNWIAASLGFSLAIALSIQGFICIVRKDRLTKVGALNLLLAATSLFFCLAVPSGAVVIGTEFSIILVQGVWTTFLLGASLVAISVCAGLFWLSTRSALKQKRSWGSFASVGSLSLLAGILTGFQFSVLRTYGLFSGPLAVRFFGLWFPPLILWLLVCLSQSLLALLRNTSRLNGFWFASLLVTPVGLYGLGWQEISDPMTSDPFSRTCWLGIVWCSFSAAAGLSVWKLSDAVWRRWAAPIAFAATGGILAYIYLHAAVEECRVAVMTAFLLLAATQGAASIRRTVQREVDARRNYVPGSEEIALLAHEYWIARGRPEGSPDQDWADAEKRLRARGPVGRLEPYFLSFLVCLLAACLFDLLFFSGLRAGVDLLMAFTAWFLLTEFFSKGAVWRIPIWTFHLARGATASVQPLLRRTKEMLAGRRVKNGSASTDKPAEGSWAKTFKVVVRSVAAVVFFMAISEALHFGATVIEPFANPDLDTGKERLGDQIAKLIVGELGQMRKDIPELIVVTNQEAGASQRSGRASSGSERTGANLTVASEGSTFTSAIPGNNELDLFGLKIPLGSVAVLVQAPLRYLLRIEEITGSVYKESIGKKTVWRAVAVSNRGKVWKTESVPSDETVETDPGGSKATGFAIPEGERCDTEATHPRSPLESLAHQLAFSITIDQPYSGMTQSAEAFASFDRGITRFKDFDRTGRRADLRAAIACFQEAVSIDRGFSEAAYRLALAYEKNKQPVRAAEALRSILNDKPNYVKALLRRANILYNLRWFYDPIPAVVSVQNLPPTSQEAVQLWAQVAAQEPGATALERRAAYLGICQSLSDDESRALGDAYNAATTQLSSSTLLMWDQRALELEAIADQTLRGMPRTLSYLPYYFCRRAEALYSAVPESDRNDPDVRAIEATVLNQLGVSIGLHNQRVLQMQMPAVNQSLFGRWARRTLAGVFGGKISTLLWGAPAGLNPVGASGLSDMFCFDGAIDVPYLHDTSAFPVVAWSNPVARYAISYFDASRRLAPDDPAIACNHASAVLYSSFDRGPMRILRQNSRQQMAIGDSLSDIAHEYAAGLRGDPLYQAPKTEDDKAAAAARAMELARFYYEMAFQNYEAARKINEAFPDALNQSAYCLWRWSVDAQIHHFVGPLRDDVAAAENNLRKALRYLSRNADPNDRTSLTTTLAELDIALGRPGEAAKELAGLTQEMPNSLTREMPFSTFLYIDMAHAYACASKLNPKTKDTFEKKAQDALKVIQAMEAASELRPISDRSEILDDLEKVCFSPPPKNGTSR